MLSGDLGGTAALALTGTIDDLEAVGLVVGTPVQPMLASAAADPAAALVVTGKKDDDVVSHDWQPFWARACLANIVCASKPEVKAHQAVGLGRLAVGLTVAGLGWRLGGVPDSGK